MVSNLLVVASFLAFVTADYCARFTSNYNNCMAQYPTCTWISQCEAAPSYCTGRSERSCLSVGGCQYVHGEGCEYQYQSCGSVVGASSCTLGSRYGDCVYTQYCGSNDFGRTSSKISKMEPRKKSLSKKALEKKATFLKKSDSDSDSSESSDGENTCLKGDCEACTTATTCTNVNGCTWGGEDEGCCDEDCADCGCGGGDVCDEFIECALLKLAGDWDAVKKWLDKHFGIKAASKGHDEL